MVSTPLAGVLAARRALFNQRVAEARHRWPGLDLAAFTGFVEGTLDPLCQAVDRVDSTATVGTCEIAFELGLDLVAQGYAGPQARRPWVDQAWSTLAPALAPLLAHAPLETLGSITNAVVRLGGVPGIRVNEWTERMARLAGQCTSVQALRGLGALCAWRAGMAHLRGPALASAGTLPPALAAAAIGSEGQDWAGLQDRLASERWWNPETGAVDPQGRSVGGFSGLGGPFAVPPQVRATADGFIAQSAQRYHLLLADAYGAVVLPASAAEFAAASTDGPPPATISAQVMRASLRMELPTDDLQAVAGPAGVALFSPWSHHVRLLPPPR